MSLSTHVNVVSPESLAKTVLARWCVRAALGGPEVSRELTVWAERESGRVVVAKDYMRELELLQLQRENAFTPQPTLDEDTFAEAKTSMGVMIPRVLAALAKKFRDKFYLRTTQQRFKLYYYFSGDPALETIALSLVLKNGKPLIWLAYIPNKLLGGADYAKAIQDQVVVEDPELAGLALMRLVRQVLGKVP